MKCVDGTDPGVTLQKPAEFNPKIRFKLDAPFGERVTTDHSHALRRSGHSTVGVEGVRYQRIAKVRRQIASGAYETPEKLEIALERLAEALQEG